LLQQPASFVGSSLVGSGYRQTCHPLQIGRIHAIELLDQIGHELHGQLTQKGITRMMESPHDDETELRSTITHNPPVTLCIWRAKSRSCLVAKSIWPHRQIHWS